MSSKVDASGTGTAVAGESAGSKFLHGPRVVLNTKDDTKLLVPESILNVCDVLKGLFGHGIEDEHADDESDDDEDVEDHGEVVFISKASEQGAKMAINYAVSYVKGENRSLAKEKQFLTGIPQEMFKDVLIAAEEVGFQPLTTLLCTQFCDKRASLANVYKFLDKEPRGVTPITEADFMTTMTSGITMPASSASAWPLRSTSPIAVYKKYRMLEGSSTPLPPELKKSSSSLCKTIVLVSADGKKFKMTAEVAMVAGLVKEMISISAEDGDKSDDEEIERRDKTMEIPLASVSAETVKIAQAYGTEYVKATNKKLATGIADWEMPFLKMFQPQPKTFGKTLHELDYLRVQALVSLLASTVSGLRLAELCELVGDRVKITDEDEASYRTFMKSGISFSASTRSKFPLNSVSPRDVQQRLA